MNFPVFIRKLKALGFNGEFVIEREISGDEQRDDILRTTADLRVWLQD
ncbi:hypothetical protein Back11_60470 [Paenibacillus baekrokdamisoli]|uniref:Uncharacterized protein n=1 Tax=Paenibacillus baekrokdamisoli TaxID=1712516 RepID=A0A3G9J2B8_9BACL|nr:hypothetical protein [Paenibacillus baekrokdamisoli]MBB3072118.1 sugar phosphate isomerase/epimerase [Paenibacillus baekrokdamisoli]BBH24702.1 hypothetical protein Back11_60470 [Paenibacillus baekrokdamisoli]